MSFSTQTSLNHVKPFETMQNRTIPTSTINHQPPSTTIHQPSTSYPPAIHTLQFLHQRRAPRPGVQVLSLVRLVQDDQATAVRLAMAEPALQLVEAAGATRTSCENGGKNHGKTMENGWKPRENHEVFFSGTWQKMTKS